MKTFPIHQLLNQHLVAAQLKNPQYSSRAFSRKLGLSSGALSEIMNGGRPVSQKIATRICDRLGLDPMERNQVLEKYASKKISDLPASESASFLRLSTDKFRMMSEWHYFAITSLINTKGFQSNPEWIAERLGLAAILVEQAISRMIRLQVIHLKKNGDYQLGNMMIRTSDDLTDVSIQKNHAETLELAKSALENRSVEERDFTSLTLPFDPKNLPEAKQLIRKFENEWLVHFDLNDKPREVYRLAIQLFPLTQKPKRTLL